MRHVVRTRGRAVPLAILLLLAIVPVQTALAAPSPYSVSPHHLRFEAPANGGTDVQTLSVTNRTSGAVDISFTSSSFGTWHLTAGSCPDGGSLAAGATCTAEVTFFAPVNPGRYRGTLTINAGSLPGKSVGLSGSAT